MYFILLMSKKHPSGYLSFSGKLENASDSVMYISGYGLRKKIRVNEHGFLVIHWLLKSLTYTRYRLAVLKIRERSILKTDMTFM